MPIPAAREGQQLRYGVCRLTVSVPNLSDFRRRYEDAVPELSSFGIPEVAAVGRELDQKLARLSQALDVDVPSSLRDQPAA